MKMRPVILLLLVLNLTPWLARPAPAAEHHRATRLGNPATRFAPPLYTPDDVRARLSDPRLHNDFISVLRQWGWEGNPADFFAAGLTNEIVEWQVPVGDTMPFMSTRKGGKPICLRNVTWAGTEPIRAFSFVFCSNGHVYRCVFPKPCSNFYVVDLGLVPRPGQGLECDVPDRVIAGQQVKICLTLHNTGNQPSAATTVTLPIPAGAVMSGVTDGGNLAGGNVVWTFPSLPVNAARQFCAQFRAAQPGQLAWRATATSAGVPPAFSDCATEVRGVPGILLEKADDPDPVAVGDTTTYTVRVTNQGSVEDGHVQVIVIIAPELVPVSSTGGAIAGQTVTFPVVPRLAAKDAVTYQIVAKGVKPGDGHTKFLLSSDALKAPISAEESTTIY